jgi:hypothetical protein
MRQRQGRTKLPPWIELRARKIVGFWRADAAQASIPLTTKLSLGHILNYLHVITKNVKHNQHTWRVRQELKGFRTISGKIIAGRPARLDH